MKSILNSIKEDTHQKALITVSIFLMLTILTLLLVSMKTPEKRVLETQEIAIETIEVESFETENSAIKKSIEQTNPDQSLQESSVLPSDDPTETKVDKTFGFTQGTNQNVNGSLFGDDGIDFIGPKGNSNRAVIHGPNITANSQEEGDIALKIWVDQAGNVIRANYDASSSSSGSQYLITLAKKAAKSMKYNQNQEKEIEFVGTAIFKFKKM